MTPLVVVLSRSTPPSHRRSRPGRPIDSACGSRARARHVLPRVAGGHAARRRRRGAEAHRGRCGTAGGRGLQADARALFEQAFASRRAASDRRAIAESLFHVALTWENKKDPSDADKVRVRLLHEEALALKAGYTIYLAPSLIAVGDVWKDKGDAKKAREYFERARAEADRIGAAPFRRMADQALTTLAGAAPAR